LHVFVQKDPEEAGDLPGETGAATGAGDAGTTEAVAVAGAAEDSADKQDAGDEKPKERMPWVAVLVFTVKHRVAVVILSVLVMMYSDFIDSVILWWKWRMQVEETLRVDVDTLWPSVLFILFAVVFYNYYFTVKGQT